MKAKDLKTAPPKRVRVFKEIAQKIRRGELAPGERLATVREMSANFEVSLSVVQNALKELMNNGFVECRGASGFYVSAGKELQEAPKTENSSCGKLFLVMNHHSDLIWRRTFEEYAKVREEQFLALFRYAEKYPDMVFSMEQAEAARVFFEQHPELIAPAKKFVQEGRLELFGALCIPDLNMVSGESLFRNFLLGREYYRRILGAGTDMLCLCDSFGMCAQIPQILAQCGYRFLSPGRMPNAPAAVAGARVFRWNSLDGASGVTVFRSAAEVTHGGYELNVPVIRRGAAQLAKNVFAAKHLDGTARIAYTTEETVLQESIFPILAEANRLGGKQLEFGNLSRYLQELDETAFPEYSGEFNPVFTGCYTTRIGVKQKIRALENRLFKAEFLDAVSGGGRNFESSWHDLSLCQFHDAACGCHTDSASRELNDLFDRADPGELRLPGKGVSLCSFDLSSGLRVIEADSAPEGVPAQKDGDRAVFAADLPPFGIRHAAGTVPAPEPTPCGPAFRTKYFKADFSSPEPKIVNLEGKNVFPDSGFGEILFRRDTGSMWREGFQTAHRGLSFEEERVTECSRGDVFFKAVTEGKVLPAPPEFGDPAVHWPGFGSLSFRKEYRFYHELDYFTLKLRLEWHGSATKVFIRFPVRCDLANARATFETPCACATRKPYFEIPCELESSAKLLASNADYNLAKGDWPALNWVNLSDFEGGLTVANTGTPGHSVQCGHIDVSLLRSGTETVDGSLTPPPGAMDNGVHEYEFAFRAHSPADMAKAPELGFLLNRKPQMIRGSLPEGSLLRVDAPNVAVSGIHAVEDGILVRLYETVGCPAQAVLSGKLTEGRTLCRASAEGVPMEPLPEGRIAFRPFEIITLLLKGKPIDD